MLLRQHTMLLRRFILPLDVVSIVMYHMRIRRIGCAPMIRRKRWRHLTTPDFCYRPTSSLYMMIESPWPEQTVA